MHILKLILIGIVLGIANLIPGVSGGTMAAVFGIYDSLIELIGLNVKKIIAMRKFWIPLAIGIASGILIFSKLINRFLELYPLAALWFFMGIIIGSLPFIASQTYKKMQLLGCATGTNVQKDGQTCKPCAFIRYGSAGAVFFAALALMLAMKYANRSQFMHEAQTVLSAALSIKLFICTALAAAAMIIPGISGSFLMVIFGTYNTVIKAVADLNIAILIPVALGAAAGLLGGAAVIRILLKRFPAHTYAAILGLVAGSLAVLYPGLPAHNELILSIVLFVAGSAASYISSRT
ncbi:DUF368 domain-containing protein [Treponema sp. HNW]|uniref:DUF368 domain-containing protein n=1 Tax=Treponema sp. HNW TaxID=3116654 RepID=UPI003D10377E